MEVQLQELYFSEVDSGRLMYEDDPEYERRRQALSSCLDRLEVIRDPEARDLLWDAVLRLSLIHISEPTSYVSLTRAIWSPSPTASVWDFGWP